MSAVIPPGQKLKLYGWESQHLVLGKKTNEFNVRLL